MGNQKSSASSQRLPPPRPEVLKAEYMAFKSEMELEKTKVSKLMTAFKIYCRKTSDAALKLSETIDEIKALEVKKP
jgi:hypothetical protein